jgi:uncharacterized protein involved in cysteine biosynthesis
LVESPTIWAFQPLPSALTAAASAVMFMLPLNVQLVLVVLVPALTVTSVRPVLATETRAWTLAGVVFVG